MTSVPTAMTSAPTMTSVPTMTAAPTTTADPATPDPGGSGASPPVIELEHFGVRFGSRDILVDLNLALTGRAIGLLGPNGAGKTTLIHTLLGFHEHSSGQARVFGHAIGSGAKAVRALVGYMPERDSYIAGMSAVHFVRMMGELSGLPARAALERAHEALYYVGLGEARYRAVDTYSLGMKQLVKLAQAIVHGPRLLFLDEPTNGLDPKARRRMLRLIRDIRDTGHTHVLVSSHLLRDVEECCEEVLVLKGGRLVAHCDLAEERKSNRRFLELELGERPTGEHAATARFAAAAEALGCTSALHADGRLKLVLADDVSVRDLYALAAGQGVAIQRLAYRRDSLQDIFMKAMEDRPIPQEHA